MTMADVTTDPVTGLQLVELSHEWDQRAPSYPGQTDVNGPWRQALAARRAGLAHHHRHAHRHAHERPAAPDPEGRRPGRHRPTRFFGNGVILDIPKKNWEVITAADLEKAKPAVQEGDIVVIVTGWHQKYSDGLEYYGEAPGLSKDAAEWLVSKKPKMVAIDTPHVDHPLATSMAPHRGGPHMKRLAGEYTRRHRQGPQERARRVERRAQDPSWRRHSHHRAGGRRRRQS